jgi:hypothetical protein
MTMTRSGARALLVTVGALAVSPWCSPACAWGPVGHALVTRAALAAGDQLPAWFRDEGDALAELANAPDRWRAEVDATPALAAREPDHFFDLDEWGAERLPGERWAFVHRAERRGLVPEKVGFLPFALLEEYGVLVSAFRDARAGRAGGQAAALAAAGTLAHLAGDAVVPLHVTRHHHGWVGPNPEDFTRRSSIHHWFEAELIAGVRLAAVRVGADAHRGFVDLPAAVQATLADALALVPQLYRLERTSHRTHDESEVRALARERRGAGATFLARLWHTGWRESGE